MSEPLRVGDRVELRSGLEWLGVPIHSLGRGTVVDTDGPQLMVGSYVEVEWDEGHGGTARFPSIQSLRRVEECDCNEHSICVTCSPEMFGNIPWSGE